MSAILALDLATQTGWAYHANGLVSSGSESFSLRKNEGPGKRFLKFRTWLRDQMVEVKPERVVYEEVMRWSSGAAAKCYCGLLGVMQTECESKEIAYEGVHVGTVKKFATKKGNATKDEMIRAVQERGFSPVDDNEADALHILLLFCERYHIPLPTPTK